MAAPAALASVKSSTSSLLASYWVSPGGKLAAARIPSPTHTVRALRPKRDLRERVRIFIEIPARSIAFAHPAPQGSDGVLSRPGTRVPLLESARWTKVESCDFLPWDAWSLPRCMQAL